MKMAKNTVFLKSHEMESKTSFLWYKNTLIAYYGNEIKILLAKLISTFTVFTVQVQSPVGKRIKEFNC